MQVCFNPCMGRTSHLCSYQWVCRFAVCLVLDRGARFARRAGRCVPGTRWRRRPAPAAQRAKRGGPSRCLHDLLQSVLMPSYVCCPPEPRDGDLDYGRPIRLCDALKIIMVFKAYCVSSWTRRSLARPPVPLAAVAAAHCALDLTTAAPQPEQRRCVSAHALLSVPSPHVSSLHTKARDL